MQFSDTTNKSGLIQTCEFWTNMGDGVISGDTTLLKIFTTRINSAFDRLMPFVLSYHSGALRFDDTNHTDQPIGTFNIVSGQSDYKITEDDNSLDIFNIVALRILDSASATEYRDLDELTLDDPKALDAMSPNPSDTGVPSYWLKRGSTVYLYPQPNYDATNGVKLFFEREPSYFSSSDTTKEPGIPKPFHELLALYASYDWLLVNKPDNRMLISRLEAQIARRERELEEMIEKRNPVRRRITGAVINAR